MLVGLLFGLVFAAVGGYMLRATLHVTRVGKRVQGTIVDYAVNRDGRGNITYNPVVSFRTVEGEDMVAESRFGSSSRGRTGRQVPIKYDPDKPSDFEIYTAGGVGSNVFFGLLSTGIGVGVVIFTIVHAARH